MEAENTVDIRDVMGAINIYCGDYLKYPDDLIRRLSDLPIGLLLFLTEFYSYIVGGGTENHQILYGFIMINVYELLLQQHYLTGFNSETNCVEYSETGSSELDRFKQECCDIGQNNGLDLTVQAFNEIFNIKVNNEYYSDQISYEITDFDDYSSFRI